MKRESKRQLLVISLLAAVSVLAGCSSGGGSSGGSGGSGGVAPEPIPTPTPVDPVDPVEPAPPSNNDGDDPDVVVVDPKVPQPTWDVNAPTLRQQIEQDHKFTDDELYEYYSYSLAGGLPAYGRYIDKTNPSYDYRMSPSDQKYYLNGIEIPSSYGGFGYYVEGSTPSLDSSDPRPILTYEACQPEWFDVPVGFYSGEIIIKYNESRGSKEREDGISAYPIARGKEAKGQLFIYNQLYSSVLSYKFIEDSGSVYIDDDHRDKFIANTGYLYYTPDYAPIFKSDMVATYKGIAFAGDAVGDFDYTINFATEKGFGSVKGLPHYGDLALVSDYFSDYGINGRIEINGDNYSYYLDFAGPNGEEIVGRIDGAPVIKGIIQKQKIDGIALIGKR